MTEGWKIYRNLKLNGKLFSLHELQSFCDLRIKLLEPESWEQKIYRFILEWINNSPTITVQTSGSTGIPKQIDLEKSRMIASAKATNQFFGLNSDSSALLSLPVDFIAGKMMLVRAFVGGFNLDYLEPSSNMLLENSKTYDFVALVPLQLEMIAKPNSVHMLHYFKTILIGGAALREDFLSKLEQTKANCWASYGMTETITHIALKRLNGKNKTDYYHAIEHVEFSQDQRGCLKITAPKVSSEVIQTNDFVELIDSKRFRLIGRADFVINSAGQKYSPEVLEQKLIPFISNTFLISSKRDEQLGERLVLVIETPFDDQQKAELNKKMETVFSRFEKPKEVLVLNELPKTASGKLDRLAVKLILNRD
ncbi:MAG: AMP-binding protein [Bacteroidales bacterium]|nr:AMP-binding protein [Bacteroidales bacterium]